MAKVFDSHPVRASALIGVALLVIGSTNMLGWLLRVPAMVEIVHGLVPMVFSTGLGFALAGAGLLLSGPWASRGRAAIGCFLIVLGTLTLAEHIMDVSLGIDMDWVHSWYDYGNTRPGRMAPNTAFGFILIGAVNARLARVDSPTAAYTVVTLTFCILTIGLTGLVGYLLEPDLLFGWSLSGRMALHTAAGMIAAAIGIWMSWSRSAWFSDAQFFTEAAKVRFLGTAILMVVTTTVGLTGFVLMQKSLEKALEGRLEAVIRNHGPWLTAFTREIVQHARSEMRLVNASALALPLLDQPSAAMTDAFDIAAGRLLAEGYRHVAVEDAQRRVVHELGTNDAPPPFRVLLDEEGTELVWNGRQTLRIRQALKRDGRQLGYVRLDRTLEALEHPLFNIAALGKTAELLACIRQQNRLVCLPNSRHSTVFQVGLEKPAGPSMLPIELALSGASGTLHTVDYRGNNVVAAYGALFPGFGFVAKQDTVEAYAVIRRAFEFGVPVIVLISILGACALYSQMDPLVSRMHASERALERIAQYDALTGLANRRLFMDRLRIALARCERNDYALAVMFIDLDGFKQVNDTLGHHAGDALLIEAARRMTSVIRSVDTVARLGGDEFTVILEDMRPAAQQAVAVANKILSEMRRPFVLDEGTACIGASVGMVLHEAGTAPPAIEDILRQADALMYVAKHTGKNRVVAA